MSFFYFGEYMNACMNALWNFYVYFILFSDILINFAVFKHALESNVKRTKDNSQKLMQKVNIHSFNKAKKYWVHSQSGYKMLIQIQ